MSNPVSQPWKPAEYSKKKLKAYASGPQVIRTRPEHATRMMSIIASWSGIEHHMTEIMANVVEADPWLSAELLMHVRKWAVRRRLLIDVTEKKHGKQLAKIVEQRMDIDELRSLQTERDKLAHGIFIVPDISCDPQSELVIRQEGYGDNEVWYAYTLPVLDAFLARIDEAAMSLSLLVLQIGAITQNLRVHLSEEQIAELTRESQEAQ